MIFAEEYEISEPRINNFCLGVGPFKIETFSSRLVVRQE